jgi:hypothetical protein
MTTIRKFKSQFTIEKMKCAYPGTAMHVQWYIYGDRI